MVCMEPVAGPLPGTAEWENARYTGIFASEAAAACGLSPERTALDVYLEKRRLKPAFEGSEYTARGKRFEPFIGAEYEALTGRKVTGGLPTFRHPALPHIGATPDFVLTDNPRYGVEAKSCHWKRAAKLGEQGTDQVFEDWLCQAQQQCFVMDWDAVDIFVMVDLHTWRLYTIERNQKLIERMVEAETKLWERIQAGDPPEPDWDHPSTSALIRQIHNTASGEAIELSEHHQQLWELAEKHQARIKQLESQCNTIKARLLYAMGDHAIGKLPGGTSLARTVVKDSFYTLEDVVTASRSVGKLKRKGHVRLTHRGA